jgi:RecB family exonuclease
MDLVFSWFADAGAWPEYPGSGYGILDQAVVGPLRLLDHVETMLGLGGPQVSSVERIAIYRQKLEAAGSDKFWSKSFVLDPWSSTRELLGWRDELIEAGWRPRMGAARGRFAHLSAAEEAGPKLPSGLADRLRAAIDALAELPRLSLRSIKLVDERGLFPIGWRTLLDHLERCGVGIEQFPPGPAPTLGDGRLTLLAADTELIAAEALAAWLASAPEENRDLVFVLGKDTALLDHSLHKAGLPRFGHSAPSPHRSLLQLLPLSFALAWEPPDPGRLLDFLLLPLAPLPRSVANKLANLVAESPGVGGEDWNAAWVEIAQELTEEEGADANKVAARLTEWREFVEPERHDPTQGMPRAVARRIAEKVSAWAVKRAGASDDPLFLSLAQIATDLATAITATEADRLDRVLIERMLEEAVGAGVADPSSVAEAAPWRAVFHPGAIWGEAGTVIWWHFADVGEAGAPTVWNELERAALTQAGCPLDEPDLALRRLSAAWDRPLKLARGRIILVRATLAAGSETAAHPLWHSLVAQRPSLEREATVRAEIVLGEPNPTLVDRKLIRMPLTLVSPPERRAEWTAPEAMIRRTSPESATSLSALLSCPLQWTLRYAGKLYPGVRQSLPNMDNLVGTLAHRIAQEIFGPGDPPEPETLEITAKARLTELLPQIAVTLLLPGAAGELAAAKIAVPQALAELARFLRSEKLSVVGIEYPFGVAGALDDDTEVMGRIDVLAKSTTGRLVVVDLKWQRREGRRRAELENGVALQLSVYARHVSDEKVAVETGYFMLRQRRFLTTGLLGGDATIVIDGPTPKETWDRIAASWKATMKEIKSGKVRAPFEHAATSLADFEDARLLMPPSCGFCDYVGLCGVES